MGNCLPFSKYIEPEMKHKSFEDSQVESCVKDKVNSYDAMAFKSKQLQSTSPLQCQSSFGLGSKEEIFFDSYDQAWLESDVEDFQSVNSDSTTMDMSSTPQIHDNNSITSSQSDGLIMAAETSSSDMKKQLIDLFRDSFANDVVENKYKQQTTTITTDPTTFYVSPKLKETTPNGQPSNRTKPKSPQVTCCLPNLVRSLSSSSSEKKKK